MQILLPKDLTAYCRKKILKRLISCAILTSAFAVILILYGNVIFHTDNTAFQTLCYIIFMLIPFALTGVPHKLIDSTYYGTIKKVDIVTTVDNDSSVKPTREGSYLKNTVYLSIETLDGKLIRKKAYSGKVELQQNLNTYHEGDLVFHLYGTNIVIVLPTAADTAIPCAVCGSSNRSDDGKCCNCGHSPIKII